MRLWISSSLILMLSCYSPAAQPFESYHPTGANANLSTTWTNDDSGLVLVRKTDVSQFTCGFISEGNHPSYLFAIFISPLINVTITPGPNKVVWSANRDYPVQDNAILNFTAAGELVLKDVDGSIVWSTNTAGKSVSGMNLTDVGNLVLFDDKNSVVWQSFDHPTDCLLPGQKLFQGQKLKSSVSLTNSSQGMYSFEVTDESLVAYVESNPPQVYYSRLYFKDTISKGRTYIRFFKGKYSIYSVQVYHEDGADNVIDTPQATQYMKLMPDGHMVVNEWESDRLMWRGISVLFSNNDAGECGYPLVCGRNSICSSNQECSCPTKEYFRPANDHQAEMGCSEIAPLTCNSTQDLKFITLENTKHLNCTADMEGVNMETCKQACLHNCSCKAAFFRYYSNASYGYCFLPSEIFTMNIADPRYINASAFIKVVTSHRLSHQVATVAGSTIGSFVLLLVVAIGFIMYRAHKRKSRRDAEMEEEFMDQVPGMPTRFSYDQLQNATENFSKKLGEGGFGSVYEGSLEDETKIAVKCLEGLTQFKKSFLAEVQSIGSIHHVNLVRLRGFCTWKLQQFLVYDFMSNGSLDKWIYHGKRERILEWECKKKIILDIAKGLAYLHEDCRQKIIHLDIKPQNILLDDEFNAKVSDFGLSKLMDKNQTQVMTTMRGTPGYMAPEWLSSVITEKVDVYSFGIVLLEILCGRKNFDRSFPEESWHLLRVFQICWEQDMMIDMVDLNSEDMQIYGTEVVEMMKMASWCLQTDYMRRPSMSSVVKVLEGGMNVESNLDYNFTDPKLQINNHKEKDVTPLLPSILSGPR